MVSEPVSNGGIDDASECYRYYDDGVSLTLNELRQSVSFLKKSSFGSNNVRSSVEFWVSRKFNAKKYFYK